LAKAFSTATAASQYGSEAGFADPEVSEAAGAIQDFEAETCG
jgi:hypothetical protein